MTSSVAATSLGSRGLDVDSDETVWTDADDPKAERLRPIQDRRRTRRLGPDRRRRRRPRAWPTVNPALVLGPVLGRDFSDSVQVVERLLSGKVPGLPRLGFNIVDVRDVADLHIRAMTEPAAAGQRFIAAGRLRLDGRPGGDPAANGWARRRRRCRRRKAPDFVLRLVGLFDTRPGRGDRRPRPQARLLLGQGPVPAGLEAAAAGGDRPRLRPQPDRGGTCLEAK